MHQLIVVDNYLDILEICQKRNWDDNTKERNHQLFLSETKLLMGDNYASEMTIAQLLFFSQFYFTFRLNSTDNELE